MAGPEAGGSQRRGALFDIPIAVEDDRSFTPAPVVAAQRREAVEQAGKSAPPDQADRWRIGQDRHPAGDPRRALLDRRRDARQGRQATECRREGNGFTLFEHQIPCGNCLGQRGAGRGQFRRRERRRSGRDIRQGGNRYRGRRSRDGRHAMRRRFSSSEGNAEIDAQEHHGRPGGHARAERHEAFADMAGRAAAAPKPDRRARTPIRAASSMPDRSDRAGNRKPPASSRRPDRAASAGHAIGQR